MAASGPTSGSPAPAGGGGLSAGDVIVINFPFSDLSGAKSRPAVILADAGLGDVLACQGTSKKSGDPHAVQIDATDFAAGSLVLTSFARCTKLFTASNRIIRSVVGQLT